MKVLPLVSVICCPTIGARSVSKASMNASMSRRWSSFWKPVFGFERNNFDKLGHFLQGFVPALIAREILIRRAVMASVRWRNFFIVCFCLALSALYELLEWAAAIVSEEAAEAFLGTQGYVWDTQSDMAFALLGAILALALLGGRHDRQIRDLTNDYSELNPQS